MTTLKKPVASVAVRKLSADDTPSNPLVSGEWTKAPSISRLRVTGTGLLSIDSKTRAGVVTTAVFVGTYFGTAETIEFPYYGDAAVQICASFPPTLTAEVI